MSVFYLSSVKATSLNVRLIILQAAATAWEQHTKRSREHSATTVIPLCNRVQQKATDAHDLIEREVSVFLRVPDNRLYMLPSTSQVCSQNISCGLCMNLFGVCNEVQVVLVNKVGFMHH